MIANDFLWGRFSFGFGLGPWGRWRPPRIHFYGRYYKGFMADFGQIQFYVGVRI